MRRPWELPPFNRWTVKRLRTPRMLDVRVRPEAVLYELVPDLAPKPTMHLWRVLRYLHLWVVAREEERASLFDAAALLELEESILLSAYDRRLGDPLAVIVCHLVSPGPMEKLTWACICVAEWASHHGFTHTKLGFAYCAAYAANSVRYYLVAELAAVGLDLAELPDGDPENRRKDLEFRRRHLAALIAADGGLVSLTGY
jgi:hypothetical protein